MARRATGFVWSAKEFDRRWNKDGRLRLVDDSGRQYQLVSPLEAEVWERSASDKRFLEQTCAQYGMPYVADHSLGAFAPNDVLHLMYRMRPGVSHPFSIRPDEVSEGILAQNFCPVASEPHSLRLQRLKVIPQSNDWKRCTGFVVVRVEQ